MRAYDLRVLVESGFDRAYHSGITLPSPDAPTGEPYVVIKGDGSTHFSAVQSFLNNVGAYKDKIPGKPSLYWRVQPEITNDGRDIYARLLLSRKGVRPPYKSCSECGCHNDG